MRRLVASLGLGDKKMSRKLLLVLGFILPIAGCDTITEQIADPEPSIADGGQLVDSDPFNEEVDLVALLDPDGKAQTAYNSKYGTNSFQELAKNGGRGKQIDLAFNVFDTYPRDARQRRNEVQERLLFASNQRCNIFKSVLYQTRSKTNFTLGSTFHNYWDCGCYRNWC